MASSAAPAPPDGPSPARRPRRRVGRLPVAIVAVIGGVAILGVGVARTAGGLTSSATPTSGLPSGLAVASLGPAGSVTVPPPSGPAAAGSSADPGAPNPPGPSLAERRRAALLVHLQAELDGVRSRLGIPGASATILLPDGTSWTGTSGLADVATRRPVTADTAFAFASISKTFTSALILRLVDEGRLSLADSAAGLLPPLRYAVDPRITVAMLLAHTSGLADYFLNPKIDKPLQSRPAAAWTPDMALAYVGKRVSPPGRAYHYSNTNYLLLGLIAERLTGRSLGAAIRSDLLEPAGLGSIYTQVDEPTAADLAHGYRFAGTKLTAKPIDLADGSGVAPFQSVVTAAGGAGAMAGTSADLARWARALYGGHVLGPTGTALLLGGFRPATNYASGVAYGYGVQALSIDGHPSLGHSGRLLGFRGAVRDFPIDGLTIAVLTNQSRADPGELVRALLSAAVPTSPICHVCTLPD
jgi:D-alanyl-D-alanine carboxypeptidase